MGRLGYKSIESNHHHFDKSLRLYSGVMDSSSRILVHLYDFNCCYLWTKRALFSDCGCVAGLIDPLCIGIVYDVHYTCTRSDYVA